MRNKLFAGAFLLIGLSISLSVGAARTAAQGPAGAGAGAAVQDDSRSNNPLSWLKKDPKSPTDAPDARLAAEKTLTPTLQAQMLLPASVTATDACAPFPTLDACLAALHASRTLAVDFNCLRADMTGVLTNADVSGCQFADGGRTQTLAKAIRQLKPDADAKQAAKDAEQQAKLDLKAIGS